MRGNKACSAAHLLQLHNLDPPIPKHQRNLAALEFQGFVAKHRAALAGEGGDVGGVGGELFQAGHGGDEADGLIRRTGSGRRH